MFTNKMFTYDHYTPKRGFTWNRNTLEDWYRAQSEQIEKHEYECSRFSVFMNDSYVQRLCSPEAISDMKKNLKDEHDCVYKVLLENLTKEEFQSRLKKSRKEKAMENCKKFQA